MTKTAFIAIVGCPNVGKSSLLNKMLGVKVAIVSSKPQTTRTKIMGVLTEDDVQLVFTDTPGSHKPHNKLGERMYQAV
ncbi:MAG: 50S ribosome-binding GTPase, partial [Eubacterium sp.]|nr:50S ribosome-binding GTPase [Eubacterium sp.]